MNNLLVLLAIQVIISILIFVWVRIKVMHSLDDGDSIARVRREIGALIVELDGSADRNITILEDRLRELKDCISDADKRIVMLSNERARASSAPPVPIQQFVHEEPPRGGSLVPALGRVEAALALPSEDQNSVLNQVPDVTPDSAASGSPSTVPIPALASKVGFQGGMAAASVPFIRFSEKPVVFEEPFADRVSRLYRRGFSSDIIAAKLKATIAEVDLAIAAGSGSVEIRGDD